MGSLSIWHWLIVLGIIVLVFGTKKLGNFGGDLGKAVKGFKSAMKDGESEAAKNTAEITDSDKPAQPTTQAERDKTQV